MSQDNEAAEQNQEFNKVALAVQKLMIDAELSPDEIIELHVRGMWGMAIYTASNIQIARSNLTNYFTQFSDELLEKLDKEDFNAKLRIRSRGRRVVPAGLDASRVFGD
jgi:hypothetical protein